MQRSISKLFVAAILFVAIAAAAAGPASASGASVNEASMLRLVNHARTQRGLSPLRLHAALSRAARAHSSDMMRRHYFSHLSPGGVSCAARARSAGYSTSGYRSWAISEVIGWGTSSVGTPEAVFRAWMRSAYHRSIILGPLWRDAGVGCVSGAFQRTSGSWMYTLDVGRRID